MNISNLISDLKGYDYWRIVSVRKIFLTKDSNYHLSVLFQPVAIDNRTSSDVFVQKIKKFDASPQQEIVLNINMSRACIVGSIWSKIDKGEILEPNFFEHFIINENFLNHSKLKSDKLKNKINSSYIPKGVNNSIECNSDIVTYELMKPLYQNSLGPNKTSIAFDKKSGNNSEFIAFYSSEIYRYFLTSNGISDLNLRLLKPNLFNCEENDVCDFTKSIQASRSIKKTVVLKNSNDQNNIQLIGNLTHIEQFRSQLNQISFNVNLKKPTFSNCVLPISTFSDFEFRAKRVLDIEGKWGLLVFQIIKCKGYTNNKYLPIIPFKEKTPMKKGASIIPFPDKNYKENTDSITTSTIGYPKGSINLESENNLSFLNPENETVVLSSKFYSVEVEQNGQNIYIIQGGSKVHGFKNGPYGTRTGKEYKNNDKVEPKKYFPLFISIINKISENLNQYSPKFQCVNQRLEYEDEFCPIDLSILKNTKSEHEAIYFYFLVFEVQNKYFSIIEKQITHNNNRLWLYSYDSFVKPKNEMINDLIDRYFNQKEPSSPKRFAPDNKMNHLHAGTGNHSQISDDEAIVSQANKISNRILKCLD